MRSIRWLAAALVAVASAAVAAASPVSQNIRNGKGGPPAGKLLEAGLAPPDLRAPPLAPGVPRGTLAAARHESAIGALRAQAGVDAVLIFDTARGHVVRAKDLDVPPYAPGEARESALEFLRANAEAFGLPAAPQESWIVSDVEGVAGTRHLAFQEPAADGTPIYGAVVTVHTDALGAILMVQSEADPGPIVFRPAQPIPASLALLRAGDVTVRGGPSSTTRLVYFRAGEAAHPFGQPAAVPGYRLTYQCDVGADRTFVDAETGDVVERVDRRCYDTVQGHVYDPNSLTNETSGAPPVQNAPPWNGDVIATVVTRNCTNVDTSGNISGQFVQINDLVNAPGIRTQQSNTFLFDPASAQPQVEQTCVYYYVNETGGRVQQLVQQAGVNFAAIQANLPLKAVLNISNDANAFFDPSDHSLQFGQGNVSKGIVNIQRDFDVASHEFGHDVESTYAADLAPRQNSPRRAIAEGVADFNAAANNVIADPNNPGQELFRGGTVQSASCIGDSTIPNSGGGSGSPFSCLRELHGSLHYPGDLVGEEHADGQLIGQSLWSMSSLISGNGPAGNPTTVGLDEGYRVYVAGLSFLPNVGAQFSDFVDALVAGDNRRNGGVNRTAITSGFAQHGIVGNSSPPAPQTGSPAVQPKQIFFGVPADFPLGPNATARYIVRIPGNSAQLNITVQATSGLGTERAQLYAAPNNYAGNSALIVSSLAPGTASQAVTVTASQAMGFNSSGAQTSSSTPTVGADVFWLMDVVTPAGGPSGATFQLVATNPLSPPAVNLGSFTGANTLSQGGNIMSPTQVDVYYFQGTSFQTAGVTVNATSGNLQPMVFLFDSSFTAVYGDNTGAVSGSATIHGAPLQPVGDLTKASDRFAVAVMPFFSEGQPNPSTTGNYTLTVGPGVLPGTPLPLPGAGGTASLTDSIRDGQINIYTIRLSGTETSLGFETEPVNRTTTGDIDLYMEPANTRSQFPDYQSQGPTSSEAVLATNSTSPPVGSSRFWYVIVFGYNVSPLTSGVAGQTEQYTLTTYVNQTPPLYAARHSFGDSGGGGGGCGVSISSGDPSRIGLWLPTLAALAGLALLARRRRG